MKIKEIKTSNVYYDALMHLYCKAVEKGNTAEDELAFETLDKLIDAVETLVMNVMPKER